MRTSVSAGSPRNSRRTQVGFLINSIFGLVTERLTSAAGRKEFLICFLSGWGQMER